MTLGVLRASLKADRQVIVTSTTDYKSRAFAELSSEVAGCRACPRMDGRRRVLGPANGPLDARVLFVAEAPGRLGADRCGVPLCGDASGRTFERLLAAAGLQRDRVFVTNAVLCNPRTARGTNARPSRSELVACAPYLAETIRIIDPAVVVTLGAVALASVGLVAAHELVLARDAARPLRWNGRLLFPLYHPGPRALIRRPIEAQKSDFLALRALLDASVRNARPGRRSRHPEMGVPHPAS